MFSKSYADVFQGDERWRGLSVPKGETYAWEKDSTYIRRAPYFDDMSVKPAPVARHQEGARAGGARRQRHHRPHLARRIDQERRSRRKISAGTWREAGGLQLLRIAPRQSRSDGARHLRQRPPAQQAGRDRRRIHAASADEHRNVDLRRVGKISRRGHAARHSRRQGIRIRLVARLGGQGPGAAGRARRDRRKLRTHSPLEPGGHGQCCRCSSPRARTRNRSS